MGAPRVSVLMSAYEAEDTIADAVQSVLDQTFVDFELVIINDGSTDTTAEVLGGFGDERLVVHHQENKGLGQPLNPWLRSCRGHYIARMDADDISEPERLERQVAFLDRESDVMMVGSSFRFFTDDGVADPIPLFPDNERIVNGMLAGWHTMSHATIMFRAELLDDIDGYAFSGAGEDWSLLLDASRHGSLANITDALYRVRLDATSASWSAAGDVLKGFSYARSRHAALNAGGDLSTDEFEQLWSERNRFTKLRHRAGAISSVLHRRSVVEALAGSPAKAKLLLAQAALLDPNKTLGAIRKKLSNLAAR